jgi:hypothetical protein
VGGTRRIRRWLAPVPLLAALAVAAFALGGFSAGTTAASDAACRPDASAGVHDPSRLSIKSKCEVVTGTIVSRNSSRSQETDGDWSFDIQVDSSLQGTFPPIMHAEIVPQDSITPPALGAHVRLVGPWVIDNQAFNSSPDEIHPVWSVGGVACTTCPVANPPGAPGAPTVTPHNGGVNLSWPAPTNDGGSPITGYVITYSPARVSDGHTESVRSGASTSTTIDGFANGTAYSFTVSALNGAGRGPAGPPASGTPFTVPGAPSSVRATASNAGAQVNWTPPGSNGGQAITAYTITASPGGGKITVGPAATQSGFPGLTNGTTYTFAVTAANAAGGGPATISNAVTPLAPLPPAPPQAPPPSSSPPGSTPPATPPPATGQGFWMASTAGAVLPLGAAQSFGSTTGIHLNQPVVGIASTPSGNGYWMTATDGGIFNFGDARFFGSTGSIRLNKPIVGIAGTRSGNGYWLVASDGGIFSFGDARFLGSTGSIRLNKPIVGMAPTPSGNGYWLVASDGGIFAFGDAAFRGSTGSIRLNQPIVGMAGTASGNGYWMVASDGGMFNFGDASFRGSAAGLAPTPVVGMAATQSGNGYWLVTAGGQSFAFGDAAVLGGGSTGSPIVGVGRLH